MVEDEERCGPVCISLSDLSESKGGTLETEWNPTASKDTSVEIG